MYHALVASGAENIDIMFMILSAAEDIIVRGGGGMG
jgi:hypothetical protein